MRAVILCSECGRPRLIFSKLKEQASNKTLKQLDAYCEEAIFTCGDALFPETAEGSDAKGSDAKLAAIFYNREALSCRNRMEKE